MVFLEFRCVPSAALGKSSAGGWNRAALHLLGCLTGESLPCASAGSSACACHPSAALSGSSRDEEGAGPVLGTQPSAAAQVALLGHQHSVSPISQG